MNGLRAWIEHSTGHSVIAVTPLPGATSSTLYEVLLDNASPLVARLFTNTEWLDVEPDLATHEASALAVLESIDLPTPELIAVDPLGEETGTPTVLMDRLPGKVRLPRRPDEGWLRGLASQLDVLHSAPVPTFDWTYRPWIDMTSPRPPEWTANPDMWDRAFGRYREGMPAEPACFLHRDYHPTNVLWLGDRVSGVVDWVNACLGPPSTDIAQCRLNLALMYGYRAAERFTQAVGSTYNPVWDLAPALSALPELRVYPPWHHFGLSHLTIETVRERIEEFVDRALVG